MKTQKWFVLMMGVLLVMGVLVGCTTPETGGETSQPGETNSGQPVPGYPQPEQPGGVSGSQPGQAYPEPGQSGGSEVGQTQPGYPEPMPPVEEAQPGYPAPGTGDLEGTSWLLGSVLNGDQLISPQPGVYATLNFANGAAGGHGGCNSFGGSYTVDGEQLSIRDIFSTMMFCEGNERMDLETAYTQALGMVTGFKVEGDMLVLTFEGGEIRLSRLLPLSGAPFEGQDWNLSAFVGADGVAASPAASSQVTVRFEAGRVSGNASCNQYNGSYSVVEGGQVSFGPLVSTRMACEEALMQQETQFLAAMQSARTILAQADRLLVLHDGGMMVFAP